MNRKTASHNANRVHNSHMIMRHFYDNSKLYIVLNTDTRIHIYIYAYKEGWLSEVGKQIMINLNQWHCQQSCDTSDRSQIYFLSTDRQTAHHTANTML